MNKSEQINELAAALCKAQAEMRGAAKDALNPHFNRKYADLESVWNACREALGAHGLSVCQLAESADGQSVSVTTYLMHTSGQWQAGTLTMKPTKIDPQGVGSAITYARRYAMEAIVGVWRVEHDDDGNSASSPTPPQREVPKQSAPKLDMDAFVKKLNVWMGVQPEDRKNAIESLYAAWKIDKANKEAFAAKAKQVMDSGVSFADAVKGVGK